MLISHYSCEILLLTCFLIPFSPCRLAPIVFAPPAASNSQPLGPGGSDRTILESVQPAASCGVLSQPRCHVCRSDFLSIALFNDISSFISIWDSNTGKSVEKIIRIPLQLVLSCAWRISWLITFHRSISGSFSPTTSHLAVLTEFNTIDIYDVDSQSFLQTLPESHGSADTHSGKAKRCLTYSHNGCYLLAARPDSVCVWHTNAALEPQYLTYGTSLMLAAYST